MSNPVYILGGYQTDFARNWHKENKHIIAMMREAYEGCIVSTDIDPARIDAAVVGNFAGELYTTQGMLGAFFVDFDPRLKGIPTSRVEAACASGSVALLSAMFSIMAGAYNTVAIMGVEQMKTVSAVEGSKFLGTASWYEREAKGIEFPFPKLFGKLADEYDKRYGLDTMHLAMISEKNYDNAKRNPTAQTRNWYMSLKHAATVNDFNPIMWGLLKVSDCSQITDGAVCIILASESAAKRYADERNIPFSEIPVIQGWGHTTAPMQYDEKIQDSRDDRFVLPFTREAISQAFRRANIEDCWSLDGIETHDCFTSSEYMAIDHFGITNPGESWKALEEGIVALGGKLPVNPSGGLLGCGHPVGATGIRQVLDAAKQIRGTAGDYQIGNARRVATLNIGGSATTNVCFVIGKNSEQ